MAYRQNYRRRNYAPTVGRVARVNKRAGSCRACGEEIPAGGGQLYREASGAWAVVHTEPEQTGWAMRPGPVVGGCPADTDKRNAELHASGFFGKDAPAPASERERIDRTAARHAASEPAAQPSRSGYAYPGRRGKCIDAPCCGCCD